MSSHTGWRFAEHEDADGDYIRIFSGTEWGKGYHVVAEVHGHGGDGKLTNTDRFHARLIAAAPDMLEALRPLAALADAAEKILPPDSNDEHVCLWERASSVPGESIRLTLAHAKAARAAIAKAEGK